MEFGPNRAKKQQQQKKKKKQQSEKKREVGPTGRRSRAEKQI